MMHGVDPFCCPETSPNAQDADESTPCALSTKTKPDSRGLGPGIHELPALAVVRRSTGDDLRQLASEPVLAIF
jgi:hypothetical protein